MKKVFVALNLLLIACVCIGNYYYQTYGLLTYKATASAFFVLTGLVNLVCTALRTRRRLPFALTMTAGLILAMLGDIYLGYDFILGAALFAGGHVCYFAAQCILMRPHPRDLLCGGLLSACAVAFLLLHPRLYFGRGAIRSVCLIYACIISLMAGKSISNLTRRACLLTAMLALGCALFFFSDLMLALDRFMRLRTGTLCLATYYPAQCLLAASVFAAANPAD